MMEKLSLVIGPAPSERPLSEVIEMVKEEQKRITTIALTKQASVKRKPKTRKKPTKKASKKKTLSIKEVRALEELTGVKLT